MGEITDYIDVAQVTLYGFFAFFAFLVFYLRREDKREGYPLLNDRSGLVMVQGFPAMPQAKRFVLQDGHEVYAPQTTHEPARTGLMASAPWPGAPLMPTGNPLVDGVGPASWAAREDKPEFTWEGEPNIQPLSLVDGTSVDPNDRSPVGMEVIAADGKVAGMVREVWTDRAEPQIRYLEVETTPTNGGGRHVLVPMPFVRVDQRGGYVKVRALLASQFADVPPLKDPTTITKLEEDKIQGYFGGGNMYATPARSEPLL
ncbi:MAG: photosynthetic reaction center subunit H [Methylobacteriaceae bacterium]|nr:photosynthetic reaction center subunit H [Methylobacteriaceae bacterium]